MQFLSLMLLVSVLALFVGYAGCNRARWLSRTVVMAHSDVNS